LFGSNTIAALWCSYFGHFLIFLSDNRSIAFRTVESILRHFESCGGTPTADTFTHRPPRLAQPDVTDSFNETSFP
jgi:hypothetical protein